MTIWLTGQPGSGKTTLIIEHIPPQEVGDISATKIREQLRNEGKLRC
jgi:nucleoside-triphosphatase THEP1